MKNHFSCIIIDDEPQAIELLSESLALINKDIEVSHSCTSWNQAFEALRANHYDLVFLDISIQGRNGMDLLRGLPGFNSELIFVTAYSDHALHAFKFPASGYILKPIDDIDLATTVDRAITRIQHKRLAQKNSPSHALHSRIGIPDNKSINYIPIEDIIYFEAHNTYTSVVTRQHTITSAYNIGKFRDLLEGLPFYQVHRSFIVNLNCVRRYETAGNVVMDNNKEIPVSKTIREAFMKLFVRIKAEDTRK